MSLKYTCPVCGTPLGYEGLCWKCKSEKERREVLNWTEKEVEEKQKRLIQNIRRLEEYEDPESTDFWNLLGYRDAVTPEIQRAALEAKVYYPSELYYKAPKDVGEGLISALLSAEDPGEASNLMCCLAMQGDDRALEMLLDLENHPRPWRKKLYVKGADGCIATNRITVEECKVGYCYREEPDGEWDSGWRFTAGDESEGYMDDPNNAGLYKLNMICNDDPEIIPLLNTPAPCAFERDENGVFRQGENWTPEQDMEESNMDILQQCQKWNEDGKYQKIIGTLESISAEERTPEMDSELARAYNNLADPYGPKGKDMFKKAIALLEPHEEYFEGDHCWNFRIGYSYYYLDQEGRALPYFRKALDARPGDEDTQALIEDCMNRISMPQFSECFRERTKKGWETFSGMEAELRRMMDEDKEHTRGAEIVAQMEEVLNLVFDTISFEMGFNGEKYELILTPEGDKVKLFELVYFQKHAPKEVLKHWNILVGRRPVQNIGLRTDGGWEISGEDVEIWLEEQGENKFLLSAYCEKLLPMLREEEGRVWWMLTTLTDQVLGEIPYMRYIDSFDVLETPKEEPSVRMSRLPDKLKEKGLELSADPEAFLETYIGYQMKPNDDPDAEPGELRDFLASLVSYVPENDVELHNGETIGFTANDKHIITRSPGVSLPEEQMTLKISYAPAGGNPEEGEVDSIDMDDASWHMESIEEKELDVDPVNAYSHMAIYLRWCMDHDLMNENFLEEYGELVKQVKAAPDSIDLRTFIREELSGCLNSAVFNRQGSAFAAYYYGENDTPCYPRDIDDYALKYFGPERYHSDEFQDEAYLFIPFDEDYYHAMAELIEERFTNWQGQDFDEDTLEPSELADALMEYLDCECTYFPSMADDDPIMSAYGYARRESIKEGFVPVLIRADDEALLECLVMNADPEHDADGYEFDLKAVEEYRKKMLSASVRDGKAVLDEWIGERKEEAEDDDMDWREEVLGEMEGGYDNCRFSSYWDLENHMTYPLILAKVPVKNPWEIFAWLPFGNWNECPDTPELMAVAKYWFERYGAIPAAMSHDELEFVLPLPVSKENAMEIATEQYGFCPDVVDQEQDDPTVGSLADVLRQSTVWYFWWD